MLMILIWMLVATLVTGLLVGWLADMTPKEIAVQLAAMSAAGGMMVGLVSLLWAGA